MKKFCIVATFMITMSFLSQLFASCPNIIQYYSKTSGYTWQGALSYCENQTKDGYSDWRLANINELLSLCLDGCLATNSPGGYTFWSSTTAYTKENSAWTVRHINSHCAPSIMAAREDEDGEGLHYLSNKNKTLQLYYGSNNTPIYYGAVCVRGGN